MEEHHKKALNKGLQYLIDNINIDRVKVILLEEEIFDVAEFQQLEMEVTEELKVQKLVEKLKRRGPTAYPAFMKALKKYAIYKHVVLKLEELETTAKPEDKDRPKEEAVGNIMTAAEQNKILQHLSNELTQEWTFVGLNLQIPQGKITQIRMQNRGDQTSANHEMLSEWLKVGQDKSGKFLAKALLDARRRDLHDWVLANTEK